MLWGAVAAFLFGTSDIASSIATRTMSPLVLLLTVQVVGLVVALIAMFAFGDDHARFNLETGLPLLAVAAAFFVSSGSLVLFRGLAKSSVAIVSPISSTYPVVTVLLAYLFGEQIVGGAILGAGIVLAGVTALHISTSNEPSIDAASVRFGILNGAMAAILWGTGFFLLARLAAQSDPLFAVFAIRGISMAIVIAIVATQAPNLSQEFSPPTTLLLAIFSAAATTLANVAFTLGSTYQGVVLTSVVAAAYPAIPVIWSLVIGEKVIVQKTVVGLGLVVAGIVVVVISQPSR